MKIMTNELKKLRENDLWRRVDEIQGIVSSSQFSKVGTTPPSYIYRKSGLLKYIKALFMRPGFFIGALIVLTIILASIIAPELTPFTKRGFQLPTGKEGQEVNWLDLANLNLGEKGQGTDVHILGTDAAGQDLWALIWYGTRNTLAITFSVVAVSILVGVTLGLLIGYYYWADWLFQRLIKVLANIPSLIILTLIATIVGRTLEGLIIAFTLFSWIGMALQVRAQVFRVRNLDYNKASQIMGSSTTYIFAKNVFPAALPIIITTMMFIIPSTILSESALGFIGLSLDPTKQTTLGTVISNNADAIILYPRLLLLPGGVLFLITLSTQIMGDAINKVNREGAR